MIDHSGGSFGSRHGGVQKTASGWWRTHAGRLDLALLSIALLAGFALRVYRLGDANVWWDEGYSVYLARKGLLELAVETLGDVHPPIHYWILHFWIRLVGETEFAVRYSSLLFGILGIALVYWLGRRLFGSRQGRGVGLMAAFLLAFARFHVEWSQQIRMYTLVMLLTILSIALTLALWRRPRLWLWVGHVAVTTIGLYTLYISGLVPLVESLATLLLVLVPTVAASSTTLAGAEAPATDQSVDLGKMAEAEAPADDRRRLGLGFLVKWIAAQLVSLALFAPWVVMFIRTPRATPAVLYPTDLLTYLHATATSFPIGISAYIERYTPLTLLMIALVSLGALVAWRVGASRAVILLVGLIVVPPFVIYGLSFPNPVLYAPNLSVRYVLIFLPAYHLLLALAVGYFWRRAFHPANASAADSSGHIGRTATQTRRRAPWLALALGATVVVAGAFGWSLADYYPSRHLTDDFQTVARYLGAYAQPDDAIVLNSDRDWPMFLYHAGRYYGSGPTRPGLARFGVTYNHPIESADVPKLFAPILAEHRSVWLLTTDDAYDSDPTGLIPAWLGGQARVVGEVSGAHRRLTLYSTDPARSLALPVAAHPGRPLSLAFAAGPTAIGYDLPISELQTNLEAQPNESLPIAIYWRTPGPLPADARLSLDLLDSTGRPYRATRQSLRPAYPPDRWQAGQIVRGDYTLSIPKNMPPGVYTLALGVSAGGRDLPLAGSDAMLAPFRRITITGPTPPALGHATPKHVTDLVLGGRFRLLGYDLETAPERAVEPGSPATAAISPGDTLRLRLYWQSERAADRPYTVFTQLVGAVNNPASGNPVWVQHDGYPAAGGRPTDGWLPGEVIVDEHELHLPADAPPGIYQLHVGMYDLESGQRLDFARAGQPAGDSAVLFEGRLTR